jgi:23S rRNA pseudouridine955/2504/2580 synthase
MPTHFDVLSLRQRTVAVSGALSWRGQIDVNCLRMMQNAGLLSRCNPRQTLAFVARSSANGAGRQSDRNIAALPKYFNRQGNHLADSTSTRGDERGARRVEIDAAAGQRVDNFLLGELSGLPRSRIYSMLRRGEVRINGGRTKPDYRLRAGDVVRIPPWRGPAAGVAVPPPRPLLERLTDRILYEDAGVIVIDKPAGVAVHGGSGIDYGIIEAFRALRPNERSLELAHRLDRDTSGCLVLARDRAALLELHAAFRSANVAKSYDALVYGVWPRRLRTVRVELEKFVTRSGERRVRARAAGQTARTEFAVVESGQSASWVSAHPHTGRTHQIRVHAQISGHPIVGDDKYATAMQLDWSRGLGVRRLCLHARSLALRVGGRTRRFEAPVPDDFAEAWRRLSTAPIKVNDSR